MRPPATLTPPRIRRLAGRTRPTVTRQSLAKVPLTVLSFPATRRSRQVVAGEPRRILGQKPQHGPEDRSTASMVASIVYISSHQDHGAKLIHSRPGLFVPVYSLGKSRAGSGLGISRNRSIAYSTRKTAPVPDLLPGFAPDQQKSRRSTAQGETRSRPGLSLYTGAASGRAAAAFVFLAWSFLANARSNFTPGTG